MKEIEVRVEKTDNYTDKKYIVKYRYKKRFNLFNIWKPVTEIVFYEGIAYNEKSILFTKGRAIEFGNHIKFKPSFLEKLNENTNQDAMDYNRNWENRNKDEIIYL